MAAAAKIEIKIARLLLTWICTAKKQQLRLLLLNLRQNLLGLETLTWDPEFLSYSVGSERLFHFPFSRRNIDSYGKGLSHVIRRISVSYHLDSLELLPGDLVVDCGANIGALYLYLKNQYSDLVRYVAFEPGGLEFQCLSRNVGNSIVYQTALSEIDGEVMFFYSPDNADSSLIEPKDFTERQIVNGARLDTIFQERIKLLKIDAEGAELEVIKGAQNLLEHIEYITVDLGFERGKSEDSTLIEVFDFLSKNNFCAIKINKRLVVLFKNNSLVK